MAVPKSIPFLILLPFLQAQEDARWSIDILTGYYDQQGEHSAVTGGEGTEDLSAASPIIDIRFNPESKWSHHWRVGFDHVSSASIDAMDNVSGASKVDTRVFADASSQLDAGSRRLGASLGFSKEYDYLSIHGGLSASFDFNQEHSTLDLAVSHYSDTLDLYDIHGQNQGQDKRQTTDLSLGWTQILGKRDLLLAELFLSDQSGFLSSPFQEVLLEDGTRVAERLPDSRIRLAGTLKWNHSYSSRFVVRHMARYYDDDFQINALSAEVEPSWRWKNHPSWLGLSLRFHQQEGSPFFQLPGVAQSGDDYFTADRDLSTFDSWRISLFYQGKVDWGWVRRASLRLSHYERDEGLRNFTIAFGFGWSR